VIPPRLDELLRAIGPAGFEEEVAAMVSHVDGDGLLSLHKLGDLAPATLVDQRVDLRSRNGHVPGVVGRRSKTGDLTWADLNVDVGAEDTDEALELVAPGDPVEAFARGLEPDLDLTR